MSNASTLPAPASERDLRVLRGQTARHELEAALQAGWTIATCAVGVPLIGLALVFDKNLVGAVVSWNAGDDLPDSFIMAATWSSLMAVGALHFLLDRLPRKLRLLLDLIGAGAAAVFLLGMSVATGLTLGPELFYQAGSGAPTAGPFGALPGNTSAAASNFTENLATAALEFGGGLALCCLLLLSMVFTTSLIGLVTRAVMDWIKKSTRVRRIRAAWSKIKSKKIGTFQQVVRRAEKKTASVPEAALERYATAAEQALAEHDALLNRLDLIGAPDDASLIQYEGDLPHELRHLNKEQLQKRVEQLRRFSDPDTLGVLLLQATQKKDPS